MVEQEDIGPDIAAELKAIRAELAAEKKAREADREKATRDLMSFASMRQAAPAAQPAGPQPPKDIDWDNLPDPDMDRKKYDRALEAERRRVDRETRAYEQAQAQPASVDHGKRIYDMVRKQLPNADEDDLRYVAGRVAKEVPGDITVYAQHFGDRLATDIVGAYREKFSGTGQKVTPPAEDNSRSESVFGGVLDGPTAVAPQEESLGSLSGDLAHMQKKAGWSWGT